MLPIRVPSHPNDSMQFLPTNCIYFPQLTEGNLKSSFGTQMSIETKITIGRNLLVLIFGGLVFTTVSAWGALQFTPNQGDAHVIARVESVKCSHKDSESQTYEAALDVEKALRGQVGKKIKIEFRRYFKDERKLGDNGITLHPHEHAELVLTRYKDYWAVQFPFHKQTIKPSNAPLPDCSSQKFR